MHASYLALPVVVLQPAEGPKLGWQRGIETIRFHI
jgi:hypothetical protein